MVPASDAAPVVVRVLDAASNPVPAARIAIVRAPVPMPDVAALADAGGRAELSLPAAGGYTLQVNADGYRPATVRIDAPGRAGARRQVRVTLEPQ